MRQSRFVAVFLVLVLPLVLCACGGSGSGTGAAAASTTGQHEDREEERDAIAIRVEVARREPLSSLYSTSATLRADKRATVTARTKGVIHRLMVEEGDRVEAGQALVHLENDEQRIAFERADTTRDTLGRDFERAKNLYQQGLISDEAYEIRRREFDDAEHAASLAALELSRTTIKAPFTGIVVRRYLDVGATVNDGTEVYDLADLDPLYADVSVPERHVVHLKAGQTVRLTTDVQAEVIPAAIERIAPAVNPETGTVKVTLAVTGKSRIRPGAFIRVDIVTATHQEALVVPRPALVAEGKRWHIFRLRKDNTVQQLDVRLGFEEGNKVEILEVLGDAGELQAGTPVVVAGAPALTDGALVRVIESSESEEAGGAP